MLNRVYVSGDDPERVITGMRRDLHARPEEWAVPDLPVTRPSTFAGTIADLGDFDAATYPVMLDAWCRATLAAWGSS
jgi:hypothetical protein